VPPPTRDRLALARSLDQAAALPLENGVSFTAEVNLTLRFPHISSCKIKHLMGQDVEEGARMGHASR
ncbi:hypothetical protein, partial [Xanthomonas arboricola]|uniref:hypothetical protein n=1 Tax=Xanthomonas arboricola TaxID=56448 RepID=UPI001955EA80